MATPLALAWAANEEAQRWHRRQIITRATVVPLLAVAHWLHSPLAWVAVLIAGTAEALAWNCRRRAMTIHNVARSARRLALIGDAYGLSDTFEVGELEREAGTTVRQRSRNFRQQHSYYASSAPAGDTRFVHHLQESAFFSRSLFAAARDAARVRMLVFLCFVAALTVLASGVVPTTVAPLFPRTVTVCLAVLIVLDLLEDYLSWSESAKRAESVDRRLERGVPTDIAELILAFGDYAAATVAAPPIPERIYRQERDRLNARWTERLSTKT